MIPIKSKEEIEIMLKNSAILHEILEELKMIVKPGIRTIEIDQKAEELFSKFKVTSAFKNYRGFPANICVSINEEVVHGIPSERELKDGDIVSLDAGVLSNGYYSDSAFTVGIGNIDSKKKQLIKVAKRSLDLAIEQASPENNLQDISYAIQNFVEANGFSVVREFVGHGIGTNLHEEPEIPNFGRPGLGPKLKEGMALAIESMVNTGTWKTRILSNGWTAVTDDNLPSAHFEHTIVLTNNGPRILT